MRRPWKRLAVMAGLGMCLAFPMTAYAEPAEAIEEREVTYHFFDEETTGTMTLYFKDDMPSVPYISVSDYLGKITVKTFTEQEKDGKIVVSSEVGKITVDTEKDIVTFDSYGKLLKEDNYYVKPGSAMDNNYTQLKSQEYVKTAGETTMDLSKYDIDILAIDGKAYFPLTTITDIFAASYNSAEYVDGDLYFLNAMESVATDSPREGYMDKTSLFNAETRDESLVDYSYNEMCFFFDTIYGKPAQCKLVKSIKEIGFDQTLETYNEDTKKAKELLHSTDIMEFTKGLLILQTYMYDGGHTLLPIEELSESRAYPDSYIGKAYEGGNIASLMQTNPLVAQAMQTQMGKEMAGRQFIETRGITFQAAGYEMVMGGAAEWNDETALFRSGDTVVFVFNSFMKDVVPWFKSALDYAEKNGVKNFIVDLTTNGGGDSSVMGYMIAIMKNKNRDSNESSYTVRDMATGDEIRTTFAFDMNLDGTFDEADKEVAYDLNYAFITSAYSFSCGNLTPFMAKEQGIMVMGMTSGGGACSIMKCYTPDAHCYMVSSNQYFTTVTGEDVDLGVKVDAELVRITEEGELDLTGFYNIPALGVLMNEFYADPSDVEKAADVTARIDALKGVEEITVSDEKAVVFARTAYELLTPAQKALVYEETLAKLEAAEEKLEVLYGQATMEAAKAYAIDRLDDYSGARAKLDATKAEKAAYSKVVDKGKAAIHAAKDKDKVAEALAKAKAAVDAAIVKIDKDRENAAAAKAVTNAIAKLPAKAKVKTKDKAAINAAYNAYKKLTKAQKTYISTASKNKLKNARAGLTIAVNKEAAQKVTGMIKKLPAAKKVKKANKKAIQSARAAYNKLTKAQKKYVTKAVLKKLTAAEKALKKLK